MRPELYTPSGLSIFFPCYIFYVEPQYTSIEDVLANIKAQSIEESIVPKYKSSRTELMAQLYEFYENDKYNLDKLSYAKWLYRNKLKPSPDNIEKWKATSGEYRKPITPKALASFWLSHIKTNDLYFLTSIAQDMKNRKQSFNKWLFWALSVQKNKSVV